MTKLGVAQRHAGRLLMKNASVLMWSDCYGFLMPLLKDIWLIL